MATRPMRRRLSGLALAASLTLMLPAGGFLAWVGEIFARVWEQTGMIIDPNGQPRPGGSSEGDTGMMIDPDG